MISFFFKNLYWAPNRLLSLSTTCLQPLLDMTDKKLEAYDAIDGVANIMDRDCYAAHLRGALEKMKNHVDVANAQTITEFLNELIETIVDEYKEDPLKSTPSCATYVIADDQLSSISEDEVGEVAEKMEDADINEGDPGYSSLGFDATRPILNI